jgi:ribosomal protein S12 methylthiotransferase accessory factor
MTPVARLLDQSSSSGAQATLSKSRRLISPITGIIRSVEEIPLNLEDAAEVSIFLTSLTEASRFALPLSNRLHGASGLTKDDARVRAIGEAIERYCAAFFDPDDLVFASYTDLDGSAIHPSRFALYSESQYGGSGFPYPRFDETTKVSWARGYSLRAQEEVFVPACLTYLPYRRGFEGEVVLSPFISTGLACRGTFEEAAVTAICEVVERDASMIMWLNRLAMPTVLLDGEKVSDIFRDKLGHPSLQVRLIDVTTDIRIPSFVSFTFSQLGNRRLATAGASSNLNPVAGALKAVTESMNATTLLQVKLRKDPDWSYQSGFNSIRTFTDHGFLYFQPEMLHHLEFAYSSPVSRDLVHADTLHTGDPKIDLRTCVRLLADRGLEAIIVDLTTEDIAEAGFRVVRALIPGTIGLNADYRLRFLGGPRLYSAPVAMGYREHNGGEREINPYPHPFQ